MRLALHDMKIKSRLDQSAQINAEFRALMPFIRRQSPVNPGHIGALL